MDKKKRYQVFHSKNERIGIHTGLLDCNGNEIKTGDNIRFKDTSYEGKVLWNRNLNCYGLYFGLWYLDKDPYKADCYGKFIKIPNDQGMRMELIPV